MPAGAHVVAQLRHLICYWVAAWAMNTAAAVRIVPMSTPSTKMALGSIVIVREALLL